jgi:exoribonuclease R
MYHSDHKISENVGVFTYLKPNSPVIDPINGTTALSVSNKKTNRALDGDTVYYIIPDPNEPLSAEVIGIKQRNQNHNRIVGVLEVTSTKRFGNTKSRLPIYNFVPLSWRYPNLMVASSIKEKWRSKEPIKNVYLLVEFTGWTVDQKYPSGRCVSVIGSIADMDAQETALLNKNNLHIRRYPCPLPEPEITHPRLRPSRVNYTTPTILTIDPEGALDLDDAYHIEDDNIYVHIADVDDVFHIDDHAYEPEIRRRMTSVYGNQRVYNMLPPKFSTERISLNTKGPKSAVTVILRARTEPNGGFEGIGYHPSTIQVTKTLSYERAQLIADSPMNPSPVSQAVHQLRELTGYSDTHKMVESIMVATNAYVGYVIHSQLQLPSLIRVMSQLPQTDDQGVLNYLRYRDSEGAKYMATDPSSPESSDHRHGALEVNNYVHFTSPIRRYSDLVIHRILKQTAAYTYSELQIVAEQLNDYQTRTKRYYRDNMVMKLSYDIPSGKVQSTEGYIVDYKEETNNVFVYLPEYEMEYKYPLFTSSLENIIDVMDTETHIHVTNTHTEETYDVPKFQLLTVTLSVNPEAIRLNQRITLHIEGLSDLFF